MRIYVMYTYVCTPLSLSLSLYLGDLNSRMVCLPYALIVYFVLLAFIAIFVFASRQ